MSTEAMSIKQETRLKVLAEKLRVVVSGYIELTRQINNKVEDIGYNREPIPLNKPEETPKPNHFIEESLVSVHFVNCSIESILQFISAFSVLGESPIISIGV